MKKYIDQFRFEVLFLFIFFEVLLYNSESDFQLAVTIIEYIYVTFVLFVNNKTGLMYFFTFTLLAFGGWSYVSNITTPNNFWGFRLFGFSFNILYSVFVFLFFLTKNKYNIPKSIFHDKFFMFFILYSLIIGFCNIIFSNNYVDNFLQDVLTYLPYFIYIYLIIFLDINSLLKMVRYSLFLTVLSMLLSLVFNIKFLYGIHDFVLMNSFAFILPFSIFFLKNLYSKSHYLFLSLTVILLLITSNIFISGKLIIIMISIFLWFGAINLKKIWPVFAIPILVMIFLAPASDFFIEYYSDSVISFKFSQIADLFTSLDMEVIAATPSSMGNLIAEGITIYHHLLGNSLVLIFGSGFGGGIPDIFGYLTPWAGKSGYALQDAIRNEFYRMHLPIYEIIIKSGIVGFVLYLKLLRKYLNSKSIFSFITFVLLFTVFYVTKEMLLLTLIFMKISQEEYNISPRIQENIISKINKSD